MTAKTDELIRDLAGRLTPAAPLPRPSARSAAWTAGSLIYVGVILVWMVPAATLVERLSDGGLALQQLAALATAIAAAAAAFSTTIPGYRPYVLLSVAVAATVWLAAVLSGSVQDWMSAGSAGLALRSDWRCVAGILMVGAVPGLVMARMLRRGAPLAPRTTTALAALATASLGNIGMCVAETHERDIIVLIWHGATIAAVSAVAAMAGRSLLNWKRLTPARR